MDEPLDARAFGAALDAANEACRAGMDDHNQLREGIVAYVGALTTTEKATSEPTKETGQDPFSAIAALRAENAALREALAGTTWLLAGGRTSPHLGNIDALPELVRPYVVGDAPKP